MSTPAQPGRRDNGLHARDWGALVDLDPRLSEALLESLADCGVAAYVEPASGAEPFTRAAQLPARPLDRLWIDPARADDARAVVTAEVADLTQLLVELDPGATAHGFVQAVPRTAARRVLTPPSLPQPPSSQPPDRQAPSSRPGAPVDGDQQPGPAETPAPDDPDAVWAALIADFGREHDGPVPPWPVSEDLDAAPPDPAGGPPTAPRRRWSDRGGPQRPRGSRAGAGPPSPSPGAAEPSARPPRRPTRDDEDGALPAWVEPAALAPSEDDGHYEPPPPPPVPRPAPPRIAAALAFVVGVLLMFAPQALGQARTAGVALFGAVVTVAAAAAFIYLMRDHDRHDPDDGAVV